MMTETRYKPYPLAYRMAAPNDGPMCVGVACGFPDQGGLSEASLRTFSRKPDGGMVELVAHGGGTHAVSVDKSEIPYPCLIIPYLGK